MMAEITSIATTHISMNCPTTLNYWKLHAAFRCATPVKNPCFFPCTIKDLGQMETVVKLLNTLYHGPLEVASALPSLCLAVSRMSYAALSSCNGPGATLNPELRHRIVIGKEKLNNEHCAALHHWIMQPQSAQCVQQNAQQACAWRGIKQNNLLRLLGQDALPHLFSDIRFDPNLGTASCGPCEFAFKVEYNSYFAKVWDKLPSFFDLPGWSSPQPLALTE